MRAQEKAAEVLRTPTAATRKHGTLTLPRSRGSSNPGVSAFDRLQTKFAVLGRTLLRHRRMQDVFTTYAVTHRGDSRHFDNLADVYHHLAQIGGKK